MRMEIGWSTFRSMTRAPWSTSIRPPITTARCRKSRNTDMRKKLLVVAGVLAALLVVAAVAVVVGFDADRYRGQAQSFIAARLGRAVTLGRLHLSLVPFGIRVENVEIAEDPGVRTG